MQTPRRNNGSDDRLAGMIFTMSRLLRSHAGPQRPKDMQSLLQVKTLGLVAEMKNPSMKDIAEYLHILSPSATDIVNRLVRDGKLERRKDKADKRIVRLHLTPSGKKMLNAGLKQMKERLQAALSVLNAEEKSELAALLEKIIDRNNEGHTEAS